MKKQEPDYRADNKRLRRALDNELSLNVMLRQHADTHHDCFKRVQLLNDELSADLQHKLLEVEVLHGILIREGVKYNVSEEMVKLHKALTKGVKRAG